MQQLALTFRDALATYRRHFRAFAVATGLLLVPLIAIELGRALMVSSLGGQMAPRLAMVGASEAAVQITQALVAFFTLGALALLSADRRTGGSWGWREAWSRALHRARPILTGNLTSMAVIGISIGAVLAIVLAFAGAVATPSRIAESVVKPFLAVALIVLWPLLALIGPVTAIEKAGGMRAFWRAWTLLQGGFARRGTLLTLANLPTFFGWLLPTSPWSTAVSTLVCCLAYPFIALVTLSVYCDARAQAGGYTDAQLRADLDN